jgi:hypothetical protein
LSPSVPQRRQLAAVPILVVRVRQPIPIRIGTNSSALAADERSVTVKTEAESVDIPYDAIVRGNLIEEAGKR